VLGGCGGGDVRGGGAADVSPSSSTRINFINDRLMTSLKLSLENTLWS
jgi:hypothetical protein